MTRCGRSGSEQFSNSGAIAYLDTSAYVKLVLGEPESAALRDALSGWSARVSSRLLLVESLRACARYGAQFADRARTGLLGLARLPMDDTLLLAAARPQPRDLRSLDAIHLATAISIRDSLGVVFCYDQRLADAAKLAGLTVAGPGA